MSNPIDPKYNKQVPGFSTHHVKDTSVLNWYALANLFWWIFPTHYQEIMPNLFVAQYGHPLLKGAHHWSFLLLDEHQIDHATAYQVTGSTSTYEIKTSETVCLKKSTTYMGKIEVGNIDESRRKECEEAIMIVPVTRGNMAWNCRNWIVEVLVALKTKGFDVESYSLVELQNLFSKSSEYTTVLVC